MEEKTDSKNPKISDTNIRTISPEELIHMVNSTDNEEDFKKQYPKATFSRKQAKYWVEKNCHLSYASGLFLPPGCKRTEVYEILAEHAKGSKTVAEKASKKGPLKDADQQVVICKLSDPTTKKSKTFSAKTLARWDAFLNKLGVKKHLIHYYNTAALELFMQMLSNGKVKIRFTDEVTENE
ncbi:MAG: hypothetical protein K6B69_01990 [Lachnospiraceae bacterium]|nr:hypothetical protein [Lachnospiraceae bacterium]